MKKYIFLTLILLIPTVIGFACTPSSQTPSLPSGTTNATATRGNISVQIAPTGNMIMSRAANLSFGTAGTVKEVLVDIGDNVKKGQVLARLNTVNLDQQLIAAQIAVKQAQLALNTVMTPTLSSSGALASSPDALDIEIKTLQLENQKLTLQDVQNDLMKSVITAPFDGIIGQSNVLKSDSVTATTVIVRIFDPTLLQINAIVNEMDVYSVKIGQQASIQINALPSISLPATVYAISPSANIVSGVVNYPVKMKVTLQPQSRGSGFSGGAGPTGVPGVTGGFPGSGNITSQFPGGGSGNITGPRTGAAQNVLPVLKEGLTVTVSLPVQQRTSVILVPSRAVTRIGSKSIINVILSNGSIEQREVITGLNNNQQVEIKSGISEGDRVLVLPQAQQGFPGGMMMIR
jgi:RND family efflux transporter MFP subunit